MTHQEEQYKFPTDELPHQRKMARTLLERFFSSSSDWNDVLKNFDQLKGSDGRLVGWKEDELEGVLKIIARALIHDEIAQAKDGSLFIDYYERLKGRFGASGMKPEDFGITLRQLSAWRRNKVTKLINEELDSIEKFIGRGPGEDMFYVLNGTCRLIEFMHKEKRTLAGDPRQLRIWTKIGELADRWVVLSERGKKDKREYRAMLLAMILALHNSEYIKLKSDVQELTDRLRRLDPKQAKQLAIHPKV